ncbi:MAG: hypothetical protein JW940_10780 [Polyangiaceae bacterium]|nr:hypothetical protein [Polyangiaceae bacterium]
MKVHVEWSLSLDACTISHEAVRLETEEDVAEWRAQLMAEMQANVGLNRVYLLVDYAGFWVNPVVADAYGKVAEELRQRYAKDVFRYGVTDPLSAASARLQSMKRAHRSNVFRTREEAIAALNKLRDSR